MPAFDLLSPPLPDRLQVEVTAACNLRCRMCIVRYRPPFSRAASMSLATFRSLVDALPALHEVVLQGIGEPLLAPDIYAMVAYASARGIVCGFNTNATLLTRRAGERLLDAGLAYLRFSLDGATKETYEHVRGGANWETVTRNIAGFIALMHERGASKPDLRIVTVLMRRNLHELPLIVVRAADWGIPEVWAQNLSHDFSDAPADAYAAIAAYVDAEQIGDLPRDERDAVFQEARSTADRLGVTLRLPNTETRPSGARVGDRPVGCSWPWDSGYVGHDGTMLPCCMVMGEDRVKLGKVGQRSFAELWTSDEFHRFRAGLVDGEPHPICKGCAMYRGVF